MTSRRNRTVVWAAAFAFSTSAASCRTVNRPSRESIQTPTWEPTKRRCIARMAAASSGGGPSSRIGRTLDPLAMKGVFYAPFLITVTPAIPGHEVRKRPRDHSSATQHPPQGDVPGHETGQNGSQTTRLRDPIRDKRRGINRDRKSFRG
jgi:hypothetical protein